MASKKRRVRQYQRSTGKRLRKHGFRAKMRSAGGVNVLSRRRRKGRKKLTPMRPM
jgi:large subunit ribosomal protein L34